MYTRYLGICAPVIAALALLTLALTIVSEPQSTHSSANTATGALQSSLYDQTGSPDLLELSINSQYYPGDEKEVSDDFFVPADESGRFWQITELQVYYNHNEEYITATERLRVSFHTDMLSGTIHVPAFTAVYSAEYPIVVMSNKIVSIPLTAPIVVLPSGHYWVTVQSPLPGPEYKFLWQVNGLGEDTEPSTFRGYYEGKWCWGRRVYDCHNGEGRPEDMRFRLEGFAGVFTSYTYLPLLRR